MNRNVIDDAKAARSATLGLPGNRALRVATGVAVEVEEEAKLHRRAAARTPTVVCAVSRRAALAVYVHGIVGIGHRFRYYFANFRQDR